MQQSNESPEASAEDFSSMFDQHGSIMLLIDPHTGAIRAANQAAAHFYGASSAALCTMQMDAICTTSPEQMAATYQKALQVAHERFVALHRAADGVERTVEVHASPVSFHQQRVLFCIIHDITARMRAEETLRQSEELYRTLVNTLDVSVCRWLPDTTLVFANERYRQIFGLPDQPQGQPWIDFLPDSARAAIAAVCQDLVANPRTRSYEHPVIVEDGRVRHYQWIDTPIFDVDQKVVEFQSVGIDITERREAEELGYAQRDLARIIGSVASSEEAWPRCLEIALRLTGMDSGGIYLLDAAERELQLVYHHGLSAAFIPLVSRYPVDAPNIELLLHGTPLYIVDSELLAHPLLHQEQLHAMASVPIQYQGRVIGCINVGSHTLTHVPPFSQRALEMIATEIGNIVAYLRTESALRAEQERFTKVAATLPGAICTFLLRPDGSLCIPYASKAFEDLYALTLADVSENIDALIARIRPAHAANLISAVGESARTLQPWRNEYLYNHPRKGEIWLEGYSMPVREADGSTIWHGFVTDITERKWIGQQLLELNQTLEERVRQRTAEVRDLYENAPVGYQSLDADGALIMVNQTQLNWLGYTREELLGRAIVEIFTPESIAIFQENFPVFKQRGWMRDLEFEMIRKDGSLIPVLVSATAVYDEHGAFVMSRSTVFDNSERKQADIALRESEAQNRLLIEESPDAVVLFGESGDVVQLNRAFEDLSGYSGEQILGRTLDVIGLLSGESQAQLADAVSRHLETNSSFAAVEFRLRRCDGAFRNVGARVFGLLIRGRRHYLATMRDITSEKQVEETLRRANAELARAARAKDEFLANMSHELRTPLNAILGMSESLLEQVRGPLNERQQESLRTIETSGHHLLALINDILDLSKVEAGRLDLQIESVSIAEVCQSSLLFVREQALKKSLRLAFQLNDQMAEMKADPKRLKQMLVNLLSNAVKFTPASGMVRLEVDANPEAGVIHFTVQDTGIGIATEDMERLFQPFKQLDSSLSRQHEGTGLGLSLVRRLAELHGGGVTVESAPGQGSSFTISLPYRPPLDIAARLHALSPEQGTGLSPLHSALVVEDSESAAEQLARYLQECALHVVIHRRGVGALEQAIYLQPNVIVLDLLMPDQSGWEVLAQLKANPRTCNIPVIIVSVVDDQRRGLAAGAAVYLVKPVSREALRKALGTVATVAGHDQQQALVIVPRLAPPPRPPGAQILLAEDNEANTITISDYLQAHDYAVVVARNGQEALDRAAESRPDLILMDIQMPQMDGLEATRRLRAMPAYADVPIIALTALAMPGDRERCLAAGANEYLTKPVSLRGLAELIKGLLHR